MFRSQGSVHLPETVPGANWASCARIVTKALTLFLIFNIALILINPVPFLANFSVYNRLVPGRHRLPYADRPELEYSVTVSNLDALFAAHEIHGHVKPIDEYRVFVLGDSATWGWKLKPEETLVSALNALRLTTTSEGRREVRVYNLAYPSGSAVRDLLLLDYAMRYQPDMVIWMVTFSTLADGARTNHVLVKDNAHRIRSLIDRYQLKMNHGSVWEPGRRDRTLLGQRRKEIADVIRLQLYGVAWAATGIDHDYFSPYERVKSDLKDGDLYHGMSPKVLTEDDITFDVIVAMHKVVDGRPLLIINEPILIAHGKNSDVRYNNEYPRWLFDQYRALMKSKSAQEGWNYLDLWGLIPPDQFTDTEFHITPEANRVLAERIATWMSQQWTESDPTQ